MTTYALWNNKGGVGKSFLCFVAASEYAHLHSEADVYVIDLCPQANVSEILLGGYSNNLKNPDNIPMNQLIQRTPRASVAGYLEMRLNSPFRMIEHVDPFVCRPYEFNERIPENLRLVCGDNLLELLSEAIRQTSQLSIPVDAWKQVLSWIKDLTGALKIMSGERDTLFVIDCNPSFAIYTQLAFVASDYLIVPFTADDSSRRGIKNVIALLYGIGDSETATYAKINFSKRAIEENLDTPKLHTFISNRVTMFNKLPSKAFQAMDNIIKDTINQIYEKRRSLFYMPQQSPTENFINIPDDHNSYVVVATTTGTPLYELRSGTQTIFGEQIQLSPEPLQNYKEKLDEFVRRL
jgi:cellulose biosynthesis protein BcsQ